ncbi:MAG TPA: sulfatase-like hydrolase/transferase [Terriglobales bacterium]|nr:sulfatase-like hydrolase/transferase [Terriglobales bacterium]
MRLCATTILKLCWSVYLLLTSLYCLLAFLPYTYYALIKAPAYEWMPWFVHHHALLYWLAWGAAAVAYWPGRKRSWQSLILLALTVPGLYLLARPLMPTLQSNRTAYVAGLLALALLILTTVPEVVRCWLRRSEGGGHFSYSTAVLAAVLMALLYSVGSVTHAYVETSALVIRLADLELTGWSVISHVLLAVIIFSVLNIISLLSAKTRRPGRGRLLLEGVLSLAGVWFGLQHFLASTLTFEGWPAQLYAATLAAALTLLAGSLALPFLRREQDAVTPVVAKRGRLAALITGGVVAATAVALPSIIRGGDWNGVLQGTCTLVFWIALTVCLFRLRPHPAQYSAALIAAVLLVSGFTYKVLQASEIFWARSLGDTDDAISRRMDTYATQNASFQLVHDLLGNAPQERCGDLCRILREYTDIRDASAVDVKLVNPLLPSHGYRPNIFIFVIDSMRPDYLGAYNPQVDFTPHLDALARDSVVMHNVYTQYSGTTLSEPAIWAGTMLLHAHYLQPFSKVNGLEKLARADGYRMLVSYDTVLSQLLSPDDDMVKLDTDKSLWNRFEVCSTVQQTEHALDERDPSRPVLFYSQPMNVHQFAHNDLPRPNSSNWHFRPGFNNRIAYEVHQVDGCMGGFLQYLKARGLYDDSLIIVTSDHGDATGQFGRLSHSTSIYPEIVRVPLIVHLPAKLRGQLVHDDQRVSALTDITPTLYYLLGHRPIVHDPMLGHPLFAATRQELESYQRKDLFLASDVRAVYGILDDNGRFLYVTYDSPAESYLFDLTGDPNALHNVLTPRLKQQYDERIIDYLHQVADFYDYKPNMGSLLASSEK